MCPLEYCGKVNDDGTLASPSLWLGTFENMEIALKCCHEPPHGAAEAVDLARDVQVHGQLEGHEMAPAEADPGNRNNCRDEAYREHVLLEMRRHSHNHYSFVVVLLILSEPEKVSWPVGVVEPEL